MKKTNILPVLVAVTMILGIASNAFAAPFDYYVSNLDSTGSATTTQTISPSTLLGSYTFPMFVGNGDSSGFQNFILGSGISTGGNTISVTPLTIETGDGHLSDTLNIINSSMSSLNSSINAIGTPFNVSTFMVNQASTTLLVATSTFNGFMSGAMVTKLAALSTTTPWAMGTSTHSIVTGTGATGFQVSSTRNSTDRYNVTVTTTASIAGNAAGYIALEVAPTNSATASDWVEVGRCGNSQALTLAITLQSVQGTTCQLTADVPLGYFEKLRSVTTTGTVTYAYVSGVETLK